ncbi:MAG: fructosamine kinase family protein [Prochlorococcaceae cyanobacterium]
MRLQQLHRQAFAGQQGCGGEAGDAGAHHHHIEARRAALLHRGMLAAALIALLMALPVAVAGKDPLAVWLAAQLGVRLQARCPVGGGCIHRAWRLELVAEGDSPRLLFAKTNRASALPLLQAEAAGLEALGRFCSPAGRAELLVPQPLALAVVGEEAVLVLPWLEFAAGAGDGLSDAAWWAMGEALADLHRGSAQTAPVQGFGWAADNFIGSSPQINGWLPCWRSFFLARRLQPQLEQACRGGLERRQAERLLARAEAMLQNHRPEPVLVHGDLWSGNAGFCGDGLPVLYDPAVYWGDREVDLAMAQLFGGFATPFFRGYDACWPLPDGHQLRVQLYNLYHLLNHLNLFGGSYRGQVLAAMQRLLAGS